MLRIVLLVTMMTTVAQIFPSCGGEEGVQVVGWVEAKKVDATGHSFAITINSTDYEVPGYFYAQVQVGDLVKWDGHTWTIVKKASEGMDLPYPWPVAGAGWGDPGEPACLLVALPCWRRVLPPIPGGDSRCRRPRSAFAIPGAV